MAKSSLHRTLKGWWIGGGSCRRLVNAVLSGDLGDELPGIGAWGCQVWHHEITAGWWEQGYKVSTEWQTIKFEPERQANLKEAHLGEVDV